MRDWLIHLPREYKRVILIISDFCLIQLTLLVSFYFRLGWSPVNILNLYQHVFIFTPLSVLFFLYRSGLYSSITRHTGVEILSIISRGVTFGSLVVLLYFFLVPIKPQLPRSVLLQFWVISIFALFSLRMIAGRWLHGYSISGLIMQFAGWQRRRKMRGKPVIVYGAGQAGRQLVHALQQGTRYVPQAFVDDDLSLQSEVISGLKVHTPAEMSELVDNIPGAEVFLALPSVGRHRRQQIIRFLEPFDIYVRSVPSMEELAQGIVRVDDVREVDVADILGRDVVPPDHKLLEENIKSKHILVTGAGGSIGSELSRQILKHKPATLVLLDHSEFSLYTQYSELEKVAGHIDSPVTLVPVIGSVTDGELLKVLFTKYEIDSVFHAAAYKHVPLVEQNAYQGFINNVIGTLQVARAALLTGVQKMVLISTDKAVRPTNLMGASKRLSELVLQGISRLDCVDFSGIGWALGSEESHQVAINRTRFTMVRFGNVLDSSGSVIPKFRKQIREGGPVTVTHRNVTRYFMTIPEAAELVLQANGLSEGGDVFILDMGDPVKIDDLAKKMINLSGLTVRDETLPDGDIEIVYTGIRPGEKLYEELLIGDSSSPTINPKIWRANERLILWGELKNLLTELNAAFQREDLETVRGLLTKEEIGYTPPESDENFQFASNQ